MPTVSVIIPTYNQAAFLREAVESVLSQTFEDLELIVVNDGSTDETRTYLDGLVDPRVRPLHIDHTGSPALARNVGLEAVQGDLVAFLDHDDLWKPTKLARQLRERENTNVPWVYTGFQVAGPARESIRPPHIGTFPRGWILEALLRTEAAAALGTVLVERSLLDEVGPFDPRAHYRDDYDLALRLAAVAPVGVVPEALLLVRHHAGRSSLVSDLSPFDLSAEPYTLFLERASAPRLRRIARRRRGYHRAEGARVCLKHGDRAGALKRLRGAFADAPFSLRTLAVATRFIASPR